MRRQAVLPRLIYLTRPAQQTGAARRDWERIRVNEQPRRSAWLIVALLFGFMVINFADKVIVGLAGVPMMKELGLTPTQFGLVGSSFFFLFSLSAVLVGFAANRIMLSLLGFFNVHSHLGTARIPGQSPCLFLPQILHRAVDKTVGMPVGRSHSGAISLVARQILQPWRGTYRHPSEQHRHRLCATHSWRSLSANRLGGSSVPIRSPEYWRVRAEEARAIAEGMNSRDGMQAMLNIAGLYDQLASRSENFAEVYPDVKWMDDPP